MTSILLTHPSLSYFGGAELVITEFCRYLSNKKIPHDVLTSEVSPDIQKITPRTNYISVRSSSKVPSPLGISGSFFKYLRQHTDWDTINAHNFPTHLSAGCSSMPVTWLCNEPSSYHIHYKGGFNNMVDMAKIGTLSFDRWIVKNRIKECVVADSFNYSRFQKNYHRSAHIISYGINSDFFQDGRAVNAIDRYNLHDHFNLLHVGMISEHKNQLESIKCLEKILPENPDLLLILAGQGNNVYERRLREYIKINNLGNNILFTGHINRITLRDLYHAADIAIFPVKSQGSWLSPFEALSTGTPVIVSEDITSSPIIKNNNLGLVTSDYPAAVSHIRNNYAEYKKMAVNGKKWVSENLKWEKFCEELFEICESTVRS